MALCMSLKRKAWKSRTSGMGWIFRVTLVMIPRVPSLPTKS